MVVGAKDLRYDYPQRNLFPGVYYGVVEDTADPLKLGRVRARTPACGELLPTEALPWAHYASAAGGGPNYGLWSIPPVGSVVVISYVDGDIRHPVWIGASYAAPGQVPEPYAASFDEADPYGSGEAEGWDLTKLNTFSTPGGHRLGFDDNATVESVAGSASTVNWRRVFLETSGDAEASISGGAGASAGDRIRGLTSGATAVVASLSGGTARLKFIAGTFEDGEEVVVDGREGANPGTITGIEIKSGFFFRFIEDVETTSRSGSDEEFHGLLELGTPDERRIALDDSEERIVFDTPDGHAFLIDSKDDHIRLSTEYGMALDFDDPNKRVVLGTPGGDPADDDLGYIIDLDEGNQTVRIKGTDKLLFFEIDESRGRGGIFSAFPDANNAGVSIERFYSSGGYGATLFANRGDGGGTGSTNGIFCDPGDPAAGRPAAVYMYSDSKSNPTSVVKLITQGYGGQENGEVFIGNTTSATFLDLKPMTGIAALSAPASIALTAPTIALGGAIIAGPPSGPASINDIKFASPSGQQHRYFVHRHILDVNSLDNPFGNLYVLDPISGVLPLMQIQPHILSQVSAAHN